MRECLAFQSIDRCGVDDRGSGEAAPGKGVCPEERSGRVTGEACGGAGLRTAPEEREGPVFQGSRSVCEASRTDRGKTLQIGRLSRCEDVRCTLSPSSPPKM